MIPRIRRGSGGSKISHMPSALVIQPTTTPSIGSSHHWPKTWSTNATGMPSRKPKTNPKATIRFSSLLAEVAEDPHHQRRVVAEVVDHHDLGVEQLVDVDPDLVGDPADDGRELRLDPLDDGLAHRARQVAPQPRVLAAHHLVDELRDLGTEDGDDVLGDLVGLELLVELRRACPSFAIALSTAMLPILAARAGMIPCQPTPPWRMPGTSCSLRGSTRGELAHPGDPDAVEAAPGRRASPARTS